jgi:hypothetical protein
MPLLLGPCMFLAPLVMVLAILAIPLWPVVLVALGAAWLIVWPAAFLARALGIHSLDVAAAKLGGWFRFMLTPWTYFDVPAKPAAPAVSDASAAPVDPANSTPPEAP